MSSGEDSATKTKVQSPPVANEAATPTAPSVDSQTPGEDGGISWILRRWKREDLLNRCSLWLRGIALLFSFIAFIVMASNKHGEMGKFNQFEEYRYVLAVAILSTLYTGGQVFRQVRELSTRKNLLQPITAALIDFCGDQIMAYLLISAASSAVPLTNRIRELGDVDSIFSDSSSVDSVPLIHRTSDGADSIFSDSSAAAISMSFLAFFCLATSAILSGYKLSTQPASYI